MGWVRAICSGGSTTEFSMSLSGSSRLQELPDLRGARRKNDVMTSDDQVPLGPGCKA